MTRPRALLFVCAAFLASTVIGGIAQERTGRFQRTIDFATPKTVKLDGVVGPVKISTIELADLGRGHASSGIAGRMRPGSDSEASTTLRAQFIVDNPSSDEWQLTLTLELLDKNGKVIDKLTKKKDYDDETATWSIEHPLLEYVMPLIAQMRITVQGRVN
jgi:hypothetical protein